MEGKKGFDLNTLEQDFNHRASLNFKARDFKYCGLQRGLGKGDWGTWNTRRISRTCLPDMCPQNDNPFQSDGAIS